MRLCAGDARVCARRTVWRRECSGFGGGFGAAAKPGFGAGAAGGAAKPAFGAFGAAGAGGAKAGAFGAAASAAKPGFGAGGAAVAAGAAKPAFGAGAFGGAGAAAGAAAAAAAAPPKTIIAYSEASKFGALPQDKRAAYAEIPKFLRSRQEVSRHIADLLLSNNLPEARARVRALAQRVVSLAAQIEQARRSVVELRASVAGDLQRVGRVELLVDALAKAAGRLGQGGALGGGLGGAGAGMMGGAGARSGLGGPEASAFASEYFSSLVDSIEGRMVHMHEALTQIASHMSVAQGEQQALTPAALQQIMAHQHAVFMGVAAQVAALHEAAEAEREAFLASLRATNDRRNPFEEADRAEQRRAEEAERQLQRALHPPAVAVADPAAKPGAAGAKLGAGFGSFGAKPLAGAATVQAGGLAAGLPKAGGGFAGLGAKPLGAGAAATAPAAAAPAAAAAAAAAPPANGSGAATTFGRAPPLLQLPTKK